MPVSTSQLAAILTSASARESRFLGVMTFSHGNWYENQIWSFWRTFCLGGFFAAAVFLGALVAAFFARVFFVGAIFLEKGIFSSSII